MVLNFGVVSCPLQCPGDNGSWSMHLGKKAVWSRVRGEGSSHPRRMWCQAEWAGLGGDGGSRVAAWVTVIRPTQKITQWQPLLSFSLLFGSGDGGHSCSWNFLQSGRRSGKVIKCTSHLALQRCNWRLITRTGGRNGRKLWRCCALRETQRCPSPDDSNQFVESLVHVHSDFGWSLHIRDLQLSGELLALFLGYLRTERIMTHCNHKGR